MRTSLLVAAVLAMAALVAATPSITPNTPADGDQNAEPMCLLTGLAASGGIVLSPAFNTYHFDYTCAGSVFPDNGPVVTVITPTIMDFGSSAEIGLNGVKINDRSFNNAIGNPGARADSPDTQSNPLTLVRGATNTITIGVACNGLGTPELCYYIYTITCVVPPGSGGQVVGDPQFVGLRGQNYQVHGMAGEIYNIVSDAELQYNSRFVFLEEGECPVVNGKKQRNCWSHPGSYLGELGLKTRAGDRIHLITGPAKFGFQSVTVNDQEVLVGDSVFLAGDMGAVSRNSTHMSSIDIGNWSFVFENSDMYVNQKVKVQDSRNLRSHGLLGQTWRDTTYPNTIKYIAGTVDDYVIHENDIFGDNFVYNAFN